MKNKILVLVWIMVCFSLKAQFDNTVGLLTYDERAYDGYTLFTSNQGTKTYLIDNCGKLVQQWDSDYKAGLCAYLTESGHLLRAGVVASGFPAGGSGGIVEQFDFEGNRLWASEIANSTYKQHHDLEPLPNGNFLALVWELVPRQEALDMGFLLSDDLEAIWSEAIMEIQPVQSDQYIVKWTWRMTDHLVQDHDSTLANYGIISEHPEKINPNFSDDISNEDRFHANSIDYHPERGHIILNVRNLNEFLIIDYNTTTEEAAGPKGDILYRYGNPAMYDRGTEDDQIFYFHHGARWIDAEGPYKDGVVVYNNGIGRPEDTYSSADILVPDWDGSEYPISDTEAFGPEKLAFEYNGMFDFPFFSSRMSSAQVLPNNNILICVGQDGYFFEVDLNQRILWEYFLPVWGDDPIEQGEWSLNNNVFMVERYPVDYPGFEGKSLVAGDPIELNSDYECVLSDVDIDLQDDNKPRLINSIVEDEIHIDNRADRRLKINIYNLSGEQLASYERGDIFIRLKAPKKSGFYILELSSEDMKDNHSVKFLKI